MPTDFIGLFAVLAAARIRFVIVGGLALVLQGFDRLTAVVDIVIDLTAESVRDAVRALTQAGYRPLAPVDPIALADPEQRQQWQTTRNMQVFSFWDSSNVRENRRPRTTRRVDRTPDPDEGSGRAKTGSRRHRASPRSAAGLIA